MSVCLSVSLTVSLTVSSPGLLVSFAISLHPRFSISSSLHVRFSFFFFPLVIRLYSYLRHRSNARGGALLRTY